MHQRCLRDATFKQPVGSSETEREETVMPEVSSTDLRLYVI